MEHNAFGVQDWVLRRSLALLRDLLDDREEGHDRTPGDRTLDCAPVVLELTPWRDILCLSESLKNASGKPS